MTNKISEQKLRIEFPQFFEKIDTVIFESRKYNLIDRLFHFFIEDNELLKYVNSLKVEEKIKIELLNYIGLLDSEIDLLVEKIKKCYGIESVNFHKNSERILFIDNPSLLGVSPFLFDQNIWADIIIDDIRKSSYKVGDINQLYAVIKNCLNETLERLGKKDFDDLRYNGYNGWKEEISTSQDMFSLIVDDISSLDKNPKSTENIIKNLIKKNIEIQVSKIPLYGNFTTGKLIEKLIEMFAKKSIKLSIENIEDIKSFISQNFKNSKGKTLDPKKLKTNLFLTNI